MKHLKTYENKFSDNPRLQELKELLSYLTKIFNELGYDHSSWYEIGKYEIQFSDLNKEKHKHCFNLEGEYSTSKIFLAVILRIGSFDDDLSKFLQEYFKTIKGLKLHSESSEWYNTTFEVVGNLNDITKQISVEDIKMKFNAKKYNI